MFSSEPAGPGPAAAGASAQIELSARLSSIELSVVASDFRPLATGIGKLSAAVPPGIYQVIARAGPVIERKLIQVAAGGVYRDDNVDVRFPASAPVSDTTTSHEYQQAATEQASAAVANQPGPPCGLVIVVRDTRGYDGPPLEPGDIAAFDLLDESLSSVAAFGEGWRIQPKEAVATWGSRLPPGGYALRTGIARSPSRSGSPGSSQVVDQSIWLSENWQTIVFITTGPGGPRTAAASIHMNEVGMGWSAYEKDVGQALELANWGLREGRSAVPDNLMNVLLNTKFVNPMLGIIGAHSLLLRAEPDARLLHVVLGNLEGMLPGHPDVWALRWMATVERPILPAGGNGGRPALSGASWPPMLLPSYRALIAMDAVNSGAIADRSVAERAAASLLVQGIWTTWKPIEALPQTEPSPTSPSAGPWQPGGGAAAPAARPSAGLLAAVGMDPALLERVGPTDPATTRVVAYLSALSALEGSRRRGQRFATLTSAEISLATTLPVAAVDRALQRIAMAVTPSGGGGSGSDHGGDSGGGGGGASGGGASGAGGGRAGFGLSLKGILLLLVGVGLLLGGVVGAIAVCSGSALCALDTNVVDTPVVVETPVPTAPPTFFPSLPVSLEPETDAPPTPFPSPTFSLDPETDAPPSVTLPPPPSTEPTVVPLTLLREINFGPVVAVFGAGQRPLVVSAPAALAITFTIIDDPDGAFRSQPTCDLVPVDPSTAACTVAIDFLPQRLGEHVGLLQVQGVDGGEPIQVALTGLGVDIGVDPSEVIDFESATIGSPDPLQVNLVSEATPPVTLVVVADPALVFQADPTCQWVSPTGAAPFLCTAGVIFTPKEDLDYKAILEIWLGGLVPRTVQLSGQGDHLVL